MQAQRGHAVVWRAGDTGAVARAWEVEEARGGARSKEARLGARAAAGEGVGAAARRAGQEDGGAMCYVVREQGRER